MWRRRKAVTEVSLISYLQLLFSFLFQVLIVRILGASQFGLYAGTLAMVAFVEVPLVVRGSEVALRQLGEASRVANINGFKSLSRRMVKYDLVLYFLVLLFLLAVGWSFHRELGIDPILFSILTMVIPAQVGFGIFKSYFIIFDEVVGMARYELTFVLIQGTLNLTGLFLWGLYGLAVSLVVAMLAKTLMALFFTRGYLLSLDPNGEEVVEPRSLTSEGLFPVIRNLFDNGFKQIDVILLAVFQKPEVVGVYKVAKSLSSLPLKVAFPVWRFLQPALMDSVQKGDRRGEKRTILAGSTVLLVLILMTLPIVGLFGQQILMLTYGEGFREAFAPFLILLVGVWAFHGIAGWFKFWVIVSSARFFGIALYATAFLALTVLGFFIGVDSPVMMALIATSVLVVMSVAAFSRVFAG